MNFPLLASVDSGLRIDGTLAGSIFNYTLPKGVAALEINLPSLQNATDLFISGSILKSVALTSP